MFHTAGPIVADLAADETGVYVASTDSTLSALNRNNGKVKWQYFAPSPLRDGPIVTKDFVIIKVPGVGVVALDKLTGAYNRNPRWTVPDIAKILGEDEKYLYVLLEDDSIYALHKLTGRRGFSPQARTWPPSSPIPRMECSTSSRRETAFWRSIRC